MSKGEIVHVCSNLLKFQTIHTNTNTTSIDWCQPLGFLANPGPKVALASFPGSGNTWLRYLLQQATGKMMLILVLVFGGR